MLWVVASLELQPEGFNTPPFPFQVPFSVLQGEGVEYLGHASDAIIAISNYRLHIKFKDSVINVCLGLHVCLSVWAESAMSLIRSLPPYHWKSPLFSPFQPCCQNGPIWVLLAPLSPCIPDQPTQSGLFVLQAAPRDSSKGREQPYPLEEDTCTNTLRKITTNLTFVGEVRGIPS